MCVVVAVAFSAFPAFRAERTDLTGALKQGARGGVSGRTRLTAASTGLQPDHVLTMHLQLPATLDASQAAAYDRGVLRRLETLPGVRRAALVDRLPLSNSNNSNNFVPDSRPTLRILQGPNAHEEVVTPSYFAVMGIPTVSGRNFNETDRDTDETPGPEVYFPMKGSLWNTDVATQTVGDPTAMAQSVMKAIAAIDRSVAVLHVMTMRAMMARHNAFYGILAKGLAIFALIALAIAAAGIYGVVSYGVSQRTQEIGVRMALGAKYQTIIRMVLLEGARIAAIGVTLGIIGAWFSGSALAFLLYGIAPKDPATLVAVAIVLGAVALAASYFPARRAGRVEPVVALRYE